MEPNDGRLKPEDVVPVELDGVETVPLVVRNVGPRREGVLFTEDGKMIGHQVGGAGFYYYVGRHPNRRKMFRATFIVDDMPSDPPK